MLRSLHAVHSPFILLYWTFSLVSFITTWKKRRMQPNLAVGMSLIMLDACFLAHCCHYYAIRCICGILIVVVFVCFSFSIHSFSLSCSLALSLSLSLSLVECNRKWRNATDLIWFIKRKGNVSANVDSLVASGSVCMPQVSDTFIRCHRRMRKICRKKRLQRQQCAHTEMQLSG